MWASASTKEGFVRNVFGGEARKMKGSSAAGHLQGQARVAGPPFPLWEWNAAEDLPRKVVSFGSCVWQLGKQEWG